jgi:hypothetical protein
MGITSDILQKLPVLSQKLHNRNRELLRRLKRKPSSEVDEVFHKLHSEVFEAIDCLDCAHCCSTLSPIITDRDIARIGKALRVKPVEVVERYLRVDEDNDYVFRQPPCPFLGADNYCSIYAERPRACREYPHTDRRKMQQLFELTLKNSRVCPAVHLILEHLNGLAQTSAGKQ